MDQLTLTILGLFFVFFGLGAVLAMLENWGNRLTKFNKQRLTLLHRVFGYLFIVTYLVILYFMFKKILFLQEPLEPLIALHAVFALLILPLLFVKILIVRRFTGLIERVPYFGIAIFALGLTVNVISGGFYLLRASTGKFVSLTNYDRSRLNLEVGRGLIEKKCVKCHTLERVFLARKTEDGWTNTVNAMVLRDPSIREDQAVQIIHYLSTIRSVATTPEAMRLAGMEVTDRNSSTC